MSMEANGAINVRIHTYTYTVQRNTFVMDLQFIDR